MLSATSIPRMTFDPSIPENFGSLDTVFMPIGRKISRWKPHFRVDLRRRQITNYLIEDFQQNPIPSGVLDPYWYNSNIPHFLNDLSEKFSNDSDVIRLLQIPNIQNIIFLRSDWND
jgi:hypothetical protein